MNNRDRVRAVRSGEQPDRLPVVEWATWWDQTLSRWKGECPLPTDGPDAVQRYFGLDPLRQIWLGVRSAATPRAMSQHTPQSLKARKRI